MDSTIYRNDVHNARTIPYLISVHGSMGATARTAARRVAWAVAEWYRITHNLRPDEALPSTLQKVLETNAPD